MLLSSALLLLTSDVVVVVYTDVAHLHRRHRYCCSPSSSSHFRQPTWVQVRVERTGEKGPCEGDEPAESNYDEQMGS
ncbi:hypothetical protein L2E82_16068 [Cichorium intybus]|uniref:Uncharacterized protein n=1 Tax=Cichorium intybus TaxID=13427 RepID=A0ACB9F4J1_CICIN|nr:hypothetical protein L2E82_16068 [Cichorium intybus]